MRAECLPLLNPNETIAAFRSILEKPNQSPKLRQIQPQNGLLPGHEPAHPGRAGSLRVPPGKHRPAATGPLGLVNDTYAGETTGPTLLWPVGKGKHRLQARVSLRGEAQEQIQESRFVVR